MPFVFCFFSFFVNSDPYYAREGVPYILISTFRHKAALSSGGFKCVFNVFLYDLLGCNCIIFFPIYKILHSMFNIYQIFLQSRIMCV